MRAVRLIRRLGWILRVLAAHAVANLLGARLERWPWLARRLPPGVLPGPERLRMMLEDLGGTFLKLGQMLALQPDILSLEYCNALFSLLDRLAPFGYDKVEAVVQEELGRPLAELFDSFERQPIATASIGQVHVAWRADRKLAVKVQRPNVRSEFDGDIRLMRAGMRLIRLLRWQRMYWLLEPLSEFVTWTHEELDYRYEARYMERLRVNAGDSACERVPEVVPELSGRRVLTVEFLEGVTVLEFLRAMEAGDELTLARVAASGFEPNQYARNIIDNFLGDAFRHGMFHADLHPANLMILPGNVVGYIDFGITAVLSAYSRHHLMALTLAYTRGDLDGMCAAFFQVSTVGEDANAKAFRDGLTALGVDWYERERGGVRLRKNFTLMMLDMLTLSRRTGILPERDVIKYIRSAIALDGLITRFAPGFDVGRYLALICDRQLRREARRSFLSFDRLTGWSAAGGRLLWDGPPRVADFLTRLSSGELPVSLALARSPQERGRDDRRQSAVKLGVVLVAVAALVATTGGESRLGVNLLTAELLVFTATLGMLLRSVRRLV